MTHSDYPELGNLDPDYALRLRDLEAGLAQLPTEQLEVMLLVCLEDMTYEQTAGVLGIPVGRVMSHLHRGREHLRRWMNREHEAKPPLRSVR